MIFDLNSPEDLVRFAYESPTIPLRGYGDHSACGHGCGEKGTGDEIAGKPSPLTRPGAGQSGKTT